ncbi:hypothetical protein P8605_07020 [Streptomyces sp. T-3]|nr:hypothetical protein [Streptomyces sp. T-3]
MTSTPRPVHIVGSTLISSGSAIAALWISEDRLDRTDCEHLAVPWTQYATSYLTVAAAVLAIVLAVRVARARRTGAHWSVPLCLGLSTLLVAFGAFMVYATHDDAAEVAGKIGQTFCM